MHLSLRDIRYLAAYSLPLTAAVGLWWGGAATWLTVGYVFGLVPLLEWLRPPGTPPSGTPAATDAKRHLFFDGLLYLNVPLQFALLAFYLHAMHTRDYSVAEAAGAVGSVGICCGALGINVAHELGHRARGWEQRLAKALLISAWYPHFFIEHNRGHHRHVATPLDPVSARLHEAYWRFLPRAVGGELRSAWALETKRLHGQGQARWSVRNELLQLLALQLGLAAVVVAWVGPAGLLAWLGAAAVGYVLFQLVNYVEHYGLLRRQIAPGTYERVQPHHSWNSEHALGRILLYELTRHSDHHYQAARPYHTLRHQPIAPKMPTGYPGMMLLAAVPPLWFRVMNPRVPAPQA